MNNKYLISIIIVNYNTPSLVKDCIESIYKFENQSNFEIIVVDNNSLAENKSLLTENLKEYNNLKIINSRVNLGFAGGNAMGIQYADGNYYAFINSDVLFVENCFSKIIAYHKSNPAVGVCGIQILDSEKKKTISHRPFEGIRYKLLGKKFLYKTQPNKPKIKDILTEPTEVDFIIGSFMFFKAEAYNKIGGFDTNTFLYYEETDICFRLKQQGYKTIFLPHLSYIHLEGKSGDFNFLMKKEHLISYLYVLRKNFSYFKYAIIKNYLLTSYFFKSIFKKKYRPVFKFLLKSGESLAHSLKHKQKVI
jgi:GT2 family glycosyltransferase